MTKREMDSLAYSLCAYLCSRNNDIRGYWGIGMLCEFSKSNRKSNFRFAICPGELIRICNCVISESNVVTDKLVKFDLNSIEGCLSFSKEGQYSDGADKFKCWVSIAITQDGRTGIAMKHTECWSHDELRESRRYGEYD